MCAKFLTHADALIPADKGDKCVLLIQLFFAAPNGDRAACRTELDGIVRNVGEDSAEVHRVSDYERMPDRVLIPCNLIPNVFFCRLFMIRLVQVAQHGNQVKGQCQLPSHMRYSVEIYSSFFSLSARVGTSRKRRTRSRYSGTTVASQS